MKTLSTRHLFLSAAVAVFFALTLVTLAEQTPAAAADPASTPAPVAEPPAAPPAATEKPAAAATPPASESADEPDDAPAPAVATPAPAAPAAPAAAQPAAPQLRRLDVPTPPAPPPAPKPKHHHRHAPDSEPLVSVGHDAELAKGQSADVVVAVFGSATSAGDVADSVVSVLGNTRVTGPVGNVAVAVFGNTYVNSKVDNVVVAVFGSVELGPNAEVGQVVSIGGATKRDPKAIVHGQVNNVAFGGMFADMDWLHSWISNCALYGRLLAFAPHLMWAWWIALGFLALYVILALLFGRSVERCAQTLEQRPGSTIVASLLMVLLAPIAFILLMVTGVGIAIIPFLTTALFFIGLFGKAVMLGWLGRRILRPFGVDNMALAVLVGGAIVLLLYTVPVLGVVLYKLLGWLGVGVVIYTLLLATKREKPVTPLAPPPAMPAAPAIDPVTGLAVAAPLLPPPPLVPPALTLPRAGFWIRLAALVLDLILVGILLALFRAANHFIFVALAAYGAVMWKLRGSTIGGIICSLKVVRLDDRPIDWSTAVVRALGCFLSLVVMGLGFIWVAFDDQKQSWHDKIAGTTVVRVPKGVSLI